VGVKVGDKPEWQEKERLVYEKESLGFYISGHPLNEFSTDLRRLASYNTSTIDTAPHKGQAHIGGVVIARKVKTIRNGGYMFAAKVARV